MDSISIEIVLIAVGLVANGFFAGSEIALVSARISRLAELRQQAVRGAGRGHRVDRLCVARVYGLIAPGPDQCAAPGPAAVGSVTSE